MRTPRFRTIIGLLSAPAIIAGGLTAFTLASAAPAAAGQPVTQPLTPPPPSFETCKTVGNGFICEGARTMTYGPDDTGITCGTGAGAFDIFDQGTHNQHAIRFYNTDGNLTKRVIYDQYFSQFTNPLTGAELQRAVGAEHDPARVQEDSSHVRNREVVLPGERLGG